MTKISVVVNTRNEEANISRCLESVKWADEIVIVDQHSTDKTVELAKKFGAKVYSHPHTLYVEPARNFAISKATGDWILILDADEEAPLGLINKLKRIAEEDKLDFVRIPRKNIIFGKWITHSGWWPDANIRFFQKGKVSWSEKIHSIPLTKGTGMDLEPKKENAIVHHNYQNISQYLERMGRYTDAQANELFASSYKFSWSDLISKPSGEFFRRFFAEEGYKDGVHGLILALLQTFSELIKYLKTWEKQGYKAEDLPFSDFFPQMKELGKETGFWLKTTIVKETRSPIKKLLIRLKR